MSTHKKLIIMLIVQSIALLCVVAFFVVVLVAPIEPSVYTNMSLNYIYQLPDTIDVTINFTAINRDYPDSKSLGSTTVTLDKSSNYTAHIDIPDTLGVYTSYFYGWYLEDDAEATDQLEYVSGASTYGTPTYTNIQMYSLAGYPPKPYISSSSALHHDQLEINENILAKYMYYMNGKYTIDLYAIYSYIQGELSYQFSISYECPYGITGTTPDPVAYYEYYYGDALSANIMYATIEGVTGYFPSYYTINDFTIEYSCVCDYCSGLLTP